MGRAGERVGWLRARAKRNEETPCASGSCLSELNAQRNTVPGGVGNQCRGLGGACKLHGRNIQPPIASSRIGAITTTRRAIETTNMPPTMQQALASFHILLPVCTDTDIVFVTPRCARG